MRVPLLAAHLFLATVTVRADVILSTEALNTSLKSMQRSQLQMEKDASPSAQAPLLFDLGVAADGLATLLSDEVAEHGMQERQLLELALRRTREIGVAIAWTIAKKRFFYDGDAFRRYLALAPDGPRAAESAFWLVETEFYQSSGGDPAVVLAASERKKAFLARYPAFQLAPDVGVFLAIDYRDLHRHYQQAGDAPKAARFLKLAEAQFSRVAKAHPGAEQGKIAAEMLKRLQEETREGQAR